MSSYLDNYATGYKLLGNVFTGTYTPKNRTVTAVTTVKYRKVKTLYKNVGFVANLGLDERSQQFELWSSTMPGITPQTGDQFTDKDGILWMLGTIDAGDLTDSSGIPVVWMPLGVTQR